MINSTLSLSDLILFSFLLHVVDSAKTNEVEETRIAGMTKSEALKKLWLANADITDETAQLVKAHNLTTPNVQNEINKLMANYKQMEPEYVNQGLPKAKAELVEGLEPLLSYLNSSALDDGLQKHPAELGYYYDIKTHEIKQIEEDEKRKAQSDKENLKKA